MFTTHFAVSRIMSLKRKLTERIAGSDALYRSRQRLPTHLRREMNESRAASVIGVIMDELLSTSVDMYDARNISKEYKELYLLLSDLTWQCRNYILAASGDTWLHIVPYALSRLENLRREVVLQPSVANSTAGIELLENIATWMDYLLEIDDS